MCEIESLLCLLSLWRGNLYSRLNIPLFYQVDRSEPNIFVSSAFLIPRSNYECTKPIMSQAGLFMAFQVSLIILVKKKYIIFYYQIKVRYCVLYIQCLETKVMMGWDGFTLVCPTAVVVILKLLWLVLVMLVYCYLFNLINSLLRNRDELKGQPHNVI